MENQTLILIAVAAAVAYYLFFKQKEGMKPVKMRGPDIGPVPSPQLLLLWAFVMTPSRLGRDHPEVIKLRDWVRDMVTPNAQPGVFSIHPDEVNRFDNEMRAIDQAYSKWARAGGIRI
jgi:hypothetical protein